MLLQLKPRILCIDDEPEIGSILQAYLESTGEYLVEAEDDSFKVLRRAKIFRPDLFILDVSMPGFDGLAVARLIRKEPGLRHRPILFYSGSTEAKEPALMAGGDFPTEFILKGAPLGAILKTVGRMVADRRRLLGALLPVEDSEHAHGYGDFCGGRRLSRSPGAPSFLVAR